MKVITRTTLPVFVLLIALTCPLTAQADSVKLTNGLTYEPVKIKNVTDGIIYYRMSTGTLIAKPLSSVALVTISRNEDFTRAEKLLVQGKYAQAEKLYRKAYKNAVRPWVKNLVEYRMLVLNQATGKIDKAVEYWLKMVDASNASIGSLALCPKKLAPAKSPANNRAIALLEKKLKTVKSKPYIQAILKLLIELYEREGQLEKARKIAIRLTGKQHTQPVTTRKSGTGKPARPVSLEPQLRLARISFRSGHYDEAINQIEPSLNKFLTKELPEALYLLGRAKFELSKRVNEKDKARQLLIEAGVRFMEVVTFFPDNHNASEALLLAGKVNENLGNMQAARKAYSAVIKRYPGSRSATLAEKAMKRLTRPRHKS